MKKKRRETCPQLPKRLPGRPKGSGNVVMRASEITFPINKDKFDMLLGEAQGTLCGWSATYVHDV